MLTSRSWGEREDGREEEVGVEGGSNEAIAASWASSCQTRNLVYIFRMRATLGLVVHDRRVL